MELQKGLPNPLKGCPLPRAPYGWKQPCLQPRLEMPPCRSSGGGWKTRFISPWQDGILLPFQPGVQQDDALRLRQGLGEGTRGQEP